MIELYDLAGRDPDLRFSPYCWRARMALAHKGLEPHTKPWRFSQTSELPGAPRNRTLPVLVEDEHVLGDSTDIAFYLEDRHTNGPSLFSGPGGEAHARFVIAWADTILMPAFAPIGIPHVFPHLHEGDQPYFRQSREKRLGVDLETAQAAAQGHIRAASACLTPMRRVLAGQEFLGGDEPSYGDYAVFGAFQWLRCVGAPAVLAEDDTLMPWLECMLDLFGGLARRARVA